MSTVHANVRSALRQRLLDWYWIADNDRQDRVAWEGGTTYEAQDSHTYLRDRLLPGSSGLIALGPLAPIRHRGLYQLDIMVAVKFGTKESDQLAGELMEHFPPNLQLSYGGQVVTVSRSYRGQPLSDLKWIQTPVTIDWYADKPNVI